MKIGYVRGMGTSIGVKKPGLRFVSIAIMRMIVMRKEMMRTIMMRLKPKWHLCSAVESAKAREWIFLLASPLVTA